MEISKGRAFLRVSRKLLQLLLGCPFEIVGASYSELYEEISLTLEGDEIPADEGPNQAVQALPEIVLVFHKPVVETCLRQKKGEIGKVIRRDALRFSSEAFAHWTESLSDPEE